MEFWLTFVIAEAALGGVLGLVVLMHGLRLHQEDAHEARPVSSNLPG